MSERIFVLDPIYLLCASLVEVMTSQQHHWIPYICLILLVSSIQAFSMTKDLQSTPVHWPDLLKDAFPTLVNYEIVKEIVQANAVGYIIRLNHSDEPKTVFIKQVNVADYRATKKDWADLRRTLIYGRTEVRFYRDIAPLLPTIAAPHCHVAEISLQNYIDDSMPANAPAGDAPAAYSAKVTELQGAWIVLECVDEDRYYQASPLKISQAENCLLAAARLHASTWGRVSLLETCEHSLSRASFALPLRNPRELAGMDTAWKHFCQEFEIVDTNLGIRVQSLAVDISRAVLPNPKDDHCTLIHGDYKAMVCCMKQNSTVPHSLCTECLLTKECRWLGDSGGLRIVRDRTGNVRCGHAHSPCSVTGRP